MNKFVFDKRGYISLPTKYHGAVALSEWKWKTICSQPERRWYIFNTGKVATTLVTPDYVRHHSKISSQIIYYKKFGRYNLNEKLEVPANRKFEFFAVIVGSCERGWIK